MLIIMAEETTKTSNTSKFAACVLITINLITMACCSVIFAICLWTIASPASLSAAIQATGGQTLTALFPPSSLSVQSSIGVVAVTIFVSCVAIMGLYGAFTRSHFLLFMYATLIILFLLLECALMYYFTSNLVEKGLRVEDGQWAHYTRLALRCCDFNSSRYRDAAVPPWSCCGTEFYPDNCTVPDSFAKDCKPAVTYWLDRYAITVYTSLAVLHIMLSVCSFIRRWRSASRSHS